MRHKKDESMADHQRKKKETKEKDDIKSYCNKSCDQDWENCCG